MPLPHDPQRLEAITDWLSWRRSAERILARLEARVSAAGNRSIGTAVVWLGATNPLPPGMLLANGSTVPISAHRALYDRIGTTYNTGGEPAGTFRLPDYPAPALGVVVVRG